MGQDWRPALDLHHPGLVPLLPVAVDRGTGGLGDTLRPFILGDAVDPPGGTVKSAMDA